MCRITQIPYLFTECHHLSVVAAFEPCTDTHVPGTQALYCGPAEWAFTTIADTQSHMARCKNCRSRSGEETMKQADKALEPTPPSGLKVLQAPKQAPKQIAAAPQLEKKTPGKKQAAKQKKTTVPVPVKKMPLKPETKEDPKSPKIPKTPKLGPGARKPDMSDSEYTKWIESEAAKYRVTAEEYKSTILDLGALNEARNMETEARFAENADAADNVKGDKDSKNQKNA